MTSPGWSNQTTFGTVGSGPNNLTYPWGVAVTPNGQTAIVSDTGQRPDVRLVADQLFLRRTSAEPGRQAPAQITRKKLPGMDNSQVEHPANPVAASTTRRTLTRALVILPVIGAGGLLADEAVQRWRQGAEAEKRRRRRLSA